MLIGKRCRRPGNLPAHHRPSPGPKGHHRQRIFGIGKGSAPFRNWAPDGISKNRTPWKKSASRCVTNRTAASKPKTYRLPSIQAGRIDLDHVNPQPDIVVTGTTERTERLYSKPGRFCRMRSEKSASSWAAWAAGLMKERSRISWKDDVSPRNPPFS